MGSFILIMILSTASASGGLSVSTAEFASKKACEEAGEKAKSLVGIFTVYRFVCMPK